MLRHVMEHRFKVRVYYEDTDCMGIVYHANYLRFFERARTELLATLGPSVQQWTERGVIFPIYSVKATFKSPARLGDELVVISRVNQVSPYRLTFEQRIERMLEDKTLVEASVDAVCTDLQGQLREFPHLGLEQCA